MHNKIIKYKNSKYIIAYIYVCIINKCLQHVQLIVILTFLEAHSFKKHLIINAWHIYLINEDINFDTILLFYPSNNVTKHLTILPTQVNYKESISQANNLAYLEQCFRQRYCKLHNYKIKLLLCEF